MNLTSSARRGSATLCALVGLIWAADALAQQTPPAAVLSVGTGSSYTALPVFGSGAGNGYATIQNDGAAELSYVLGPASAAPPTVSPGATAVFQQASVTASLSGTTMTVTAVASGTLGLGQVVTGTGIPSGTTIAALGTGTGGAGTYTLSQAVTTESAETVLAFSPPPTIEAGGCRVVYIGTFGGYIAAATASSSTTLRVTAQPNGPVSASCPGAAGSGTISGTVTANQGTAGAAAWPMKIDQTTPGTTNGVNIAPSTASGVAITPGSSSSAEASHVLKSSAGNLYSLYVVTGGTAGYLMTFNATSAPADGAVTPVECLPVAANAYTSIDYGAAPPDRYSTGIVVVFSSTGPFTKTASATAFFKWRVQ